MGSPHSYSLGPEVQFLVDQLDELRVAEGQEVDDLIDSSQKLIPPEVSLQSQIRGGVSSVTQMGVKAITGSQWRRYGGYHSFRMVKGIPPPKAPAGRTKTSYFQDGANHILLEIL